MNTLVDMISGMEVKEDDEDFMNAVDYMFAGLEKRKPDCFAVKQYKKYKLASGETNTDGACAAADPHRPCSPLSISIDRTAESHTAFVLNRS